MASSREEGSKGEDFFGALLNQFSDDGKSGPEVEVVAPQDDAELMAFLDEVERNDGVREAAKVQGMLEALPNLPEAIEEDPSAPFVLVSETEISDDPPPIRLSVEEPALDEHLPLNGANGILPDKLLTTTNLTLKALFGLEPEVEEEAEPDSFVNPEIGNTDPLAPRRLFANRRLHHFFTEHVKTPMAFSIIRFMLSTGLDRLTLFELEGELVHSPDTLLVSLKALERAGLLVCQSQRYSLNTRSRNALLMGQLLSLWQNPEGRQQIWSWMDLVPINPSV